ncbi:hypothetical protein FRB96_001192 [Tulasnella sp. 330]|nr:hypothetical protein FRB96_001192 [Tulasnella sp. 330]KAG8878326.1 hypothetical protein FRB98_006274 [Tulasnella sp. 332]KAG8881416.1 hypothetical protein FRB97_009611 [Tulasnella sp. 331]
MSLMTNTTTGCGVHAIDFNSSGHATRTLSGRTYLLHIPANYDSSKTHAVVLSYHGYDGTSAQQEILSQFSDPGVLINGRGIIAAYPQGALGNRTLCSGALEFKSAWQGAPYASPGVDDVQFTKDIITDISSNLCVDNTRIYAAGKSNGGGFVNLLACQPDTAPLFAAFAPVSAALYPGTHAFSNCTPGRPVPIINFHGLNDTTIPFAGKSSNCGGNSTTPDIPTWRAQWAQRNGCVSVGGQLLPNATSVINPFPNTAESIWNCSAPVEGFTVNGLAHSWPTTQGLDKSGAPLNVAQFNATVPPIINFFNQFALPS